MVQAGAAANVIPGRGTLAGTVRMLDAVAWADAEHIVRTLVGQIVAPYGVSRGGHLPARRAAGGQRRCRHGDPRRCGASGCSATTATSPPARAWAARTSGGTPTASRARWHGSAPALPAALTYDLHQGNLRIDERATGIGARVLAEAAVAALRRLTPLPGYSFW